jgi:SagB-type dehydrogenase family enzyme
MTRQFTLALFLLLVQSSALFADGETPLPKPQRQDSVSLEEAFNRSRTGRTYSGEPLTLDELSAVLWATAGKRYDAVTAATRTYPSAHGRYPIAFYLVAGAVETVEPGIYRYDWRAHSLKLLKPGDYRAQLADSYPYALFAAKAPATIVLSVVYRDSDEEKENNLYVPLDAGHASQNLRLQAAALDLVAGIAGEFDASAVKALLGIEETPILFLTLGHHY